MIEITTIRTISGVKCHYTCKTDGERFKVYSDIDETAIIEKIYFHNFFSLTKTQIKEIYHDTQDILDVLYVNHFVSMLTCNQLPR